jgi:hypothetical protein
MDYSDTTVIVPVKGEPAVAKVVRDVAKALHNCRIIVIYKGSLNMPKAEAAAGNTMLVRQHGTGKGNACIQVSKLVKTKIMCFIDGDATYDADDLKRMVALVRRGADLVLGNRLERLDRRSMPAFIEFGNKVITDTANLLYRMHVKDTQTGLRAIRKRVFDALMLKEQRFGIESEMTIKARKRGYRIEEVPINYYTRVGSSKQMKLIDGIKLLLLDFKFLFD